MSTNFEAMHIPTLNEWELRKKASMEEASDMAGLMPIVDDYYEARKPHKIHLGKRSGGWVFLFNYNEGKYYTDKNSLIEFLRQCEITSEYGQFYTIDEFLEMVEDCNTWNGRKSDSHIEWIRQNDPNYIQNYIMIDGLEFHKGEFC